MRCHSSNDTLGPMHQCSLLLEESYYEASLGKSMVDQLLVPSTRRQIYPYLKPSRVWASPNVILLKGMTVPMSNFAAIIKTINGTIMKSRDLSSGR